MSTELTPMQTFKERVTEKVKADIMDMLPPGSH